MDYAGLASSISSEVNSLNNFIEGINASSLDAIWSGDAHDALTQNLQTAITKIKEQNTNALKLADALNNLQTYKNNKENLANLTRTYNSLDSRENSSQRNSLYKQINSLQTQNVSLKASINSALGSISSVSTQFEVINYDASSNSTYKDYTNGISELV